MFSGKYDRVIDRESAFEVLQKRVSDKGNQAMGKAVSQTNAQDDGIWGAVKDMMIGSTGPRGGRKDGIVQQMVKQQARSMTRQLIRGVLGSLIGKR